MRLELEIVVVKGKVLSEGVSVMRGISTCLPLCRPVQISALITFGSQTSGQLTASDPIRTTHENIAIYCGELPVFRNKKKRTIERGSLTKNP